MRHPLILAAALVPLLAACGDNRPNAPAETSPAVTEPAPGVPEDASSEAAATEAVQTAPAPTPAPAPGEQGGTDDWRAVATDGDAARLTRLDDAWREALSEARAAGFGDELRTLGALVDPNAGQAGRLQPPPGEYRCRTFKLGKMGETGLGYVAYPAFRCLVELTPGGDLILSKMTGSQRTRGLIYPDTDRRLVFLGAQAWGSGETGFPLYGEQPQRDQIGVVERIGDNRWRLVLPYPKQESKLDVMELTR